MALIPLRGYHRMIARQLGGPSGLLGGRVAARLNAQNGPLIAAAVDALDLSGGERVADVGFGGGAGLGLLLSAVGASGEVHGIDPSTSMVTRAAKEYADAVAARRLVLHEAGMEALPLGDGHLAGWISLNTIYFVEDLATAFGELARVLDPAGRAVLGIADPDHMARIPFTRYGFRLRPMAEVVDSLASAGLAAEDKPVQRGEWTFHLLVCTLRS